LLAGRDAEAAGATAEESVHLARQSGMPSAIALSLNALALTLVDRDPVRARAVLRESVQRSAKPGEELRAAFVTAQLVAGRLQDWSLTLALVGRSMRLYRFYTADIYGATCLAECARAMAETQPEAAGVLQGAAYKAFGRASPGGGAKRRSDGRPADPNANFVLVALRQTGALVAAALGTERHRQLRTVGLEMTTDEAISYALAHIDPQLLAGPLTFAPPETSRDTVT
jgi:hypothetical protein